MQAPIRNRFVPCALALLLAATGALAATAKDLYVRRATWAGTMVATRAAYVRSGQAPAGAAAPAGFVPFDSGPLPGDGPAKPVAVDVSGLQVLRLVAVCEQGAGNCNIWGEPRLIAKDGSEVRLGTLKPLSVKVGWGELLRDRNWQTHPLQVGDRTFEHGLWVHANSDVRYALDGRFQRFEAWVGEDKDRATGTVRFRVQSGVEVVRPPFCEALACDFPAESGWLLRDAELDPHEWFRDRPTAAAEQDLVRRAVAWLGPAGVGPGQELQALVGSATSAGDARWLALYGRACRARDCLAVSREIRQVSARAAFETEVANLLATGAATDDPRWAAVRDRAVRRLDLDRQFEALRYDLGNRAHFAKIAGEAYRREALILDADRDPADIVLRRTASLLADLTRTEAGPTLTPLAVRLADLQLLARSVDPKDAEARYVLYLQACELRRQIALANPLLSFDRVLLAKHHRSVYGHMCDQYYGITARPGGGLYALEGVFGPAPRVRDLLAGAVVGNGRLRGQRLAGGPTLPPHLSYNGVGTLTGDETVGGSFLSPDLSPDAKAIVFAYAECRGEREHRNHTDASRGHWDEGRCYHVFRVNTDGSGLTQLTDGTWNDFDPCWLPNGRIAFVSERRGGYLRCGRVCPTYTLYDMAPDGADINCLSFHETNEWQPSVTHDGRLVYTRWDYIDRFGCTAHMPWITTLDGRDARAVHGNYSLRQARPDMELDVRAIPGSPKFVATAAPHHGQAYGSLVIIDPRVADDDGMGPARRLTPEVGFPETQGGVEAYGTAWPLSEDYYLCVYDVDMARRAPRTDRGDYGLYLVDSFGNRELLYRDPDIGCLSPIPLRPTARPPLAPPQVAGGGGPDPARPARVPAVPGAPGEATVALMNVYQTLRPWPAGTRIVALRVLQVLPMSVPSGAPPHETGLRIATAPDSVVPARWVLGTVPVEADGSAHFGVPANREILFQALDANGLAVQSMRSVTYLRQGETLTCQGCHEPRPTAPPPALSARLALRRPPSILSPDVDGSLPFSYPRLVQPVLERNCLPCHTQNAAKAPNLNRQPVANHWYASYNSLIRYAFTDYGDGYRTTPGRFGARASKLYAMLNGGHHDLKLPPADLHRIALWLDCSSLFYGVYEKEPGEAQLRGELAAPTLE